MIRIFIVCIAALMFTSCGDDQLEKDIAIIQQFIADNNLTGVQQFDNGLHYIINEPGGTEKPKLGDEVTVDYIGYYTDGKLFDSSYEKGEPLVSDLNRLIRGWRDGMTLFGRGGRGMLMIPSELGYGSSPPSGIREDAVLVFEIVMIDFQ